MTEAGGCMGKFLRVDLTTGTITKEQLDPQMMRKYVGGVGIGTRILYDEVPPSVQPFDPENRLIFASGPLGGTRIPGSGTYAVVTKGPLTNLLGAAQSNGYFGARLRFSGYDGIIVQGASPEWVYLWIHDGEAELRSADHLLGLDTYEADDRLKEELGGRAVGVACIGPAGEHMVRYAAVFNDHGHLASTNGPGAVMGSKKLKAIAASGPAGVKAADPDRLTSLRDDWQKRAEQGPFGQIFNSLGTLGMFSMLIMRGMAPVKNYTTNLFPEHAKIDGSYIYQHFEHRKRPCWACSLTHSSVITVTEGSHAGYVAGEPDFEAQASWSSLVGNADPGAMLWLADIVDRLGLDTKEAGFTVGMAMECYNEGLIGLEQTDGLDLTWGNTEAVEQLLNNIAHRRGFGDVLAEGTMRAARHIGGDAPNRAVYIKNGISPHTHDDRGHWGLGFIQIIGDTGSVVSLPPDMYPVPDMGYLQPIKIHDAEELSKATAKCGALHQFTDSLGLCLFTANVGLDLLTEGVSASTGWDFTPQEALDAGERIVNLQRAYSIRHGVTPDTHDTISPRLASAPVDGPMKGVSVGPVLPQLRRDYYRLKGWDEDTSKPLPETLQRLGLEDVIKDIWT
jgi:aldehyde:ferredoxin oxidoreductase